MTRTTRPGMLLVGHGTRDEQGVAEFLETVRMVAELVPEVIVEAGFLELVEPTIGQAFERLVEGNVSDIAVVPLLLFAAGHAKQDIPGQVAAAAARFPHIKIRHGEPLGCHDEILAASADRFREALALATAENVLLVMVSRGTSDAMATAEVRHFVELRRVLTPVAEAYTGFMAMADPSVDEVLVAAKRSEFRTIVVQPHLLYHGQVFGDLGKKIARASATAPSKQFLLAHYIGPCRQLAVAIVDRFHQALD